MQYFYVFVVTINICTCPRTCLLIIVSVCCYAELCYLFKYRRAGIRSYTCTSMHTTVYINNKTCNPSKTWTLSLSLFHLIITRSFLIITRSWWLCNVSIISFLLLTLFDDIRVNDHWNLKPFQPDYANYKYSISTLGEKKSGRARRYYVDCSKGREKLSEEISAIAQRKRWSRTCCDGLLNIAT